MAVGKSSMARAAKSGNKGTAKKSAAVKPVAKTAVKDTAVIAACDEAVMGSIVYEEVSQVLKRDAKPGETFGIGDSMPIYYL